MASSYGSRRSVPPRAGVGLKAEYYREIVGTRPDIGFFEVHAENYMGAGGPPHRYLTAIRERYPLSLHGVGLSIAADRPLDADHLQRLKGLIARYEPGLFSEHLAWSSHDTGFLNDLLPLPYTRETLDRVCEHIDEVQRRGGPHRCAAGNDLAVYRIVGQEFARLCGRQSTRFTDPAQLWPRKPRRGEQCVQMT